MGAEEVPNTSSMSLLNSGYRLPSLDPLRGDCDLGDYGRAEDREQTERVEFEKTLQALREIFAEELWYPKFYPDEY